MDEIKKYLAFLVFPLFLLMMFFPAGEAHAATDITNKVILKNLKLTIASTGDESTGYHGENDTTVALKYSGEFSFPNVTANEIKEGDFFIVEAPSNLNLEDRTLKLEDKISGKTIGNVRVESAKHRLVFTFNSEVEDKQNIRGDFFASAKETVSKEDKIVTYVLPGGKTQIITFKTLKTKQAPVEGEVIYKGGWNHGSLAKAGYYVRINRSQQDLKNKTVEITDDISLGAFASYMDGSFALNEAEFDTTNTNFANLKRKIKSYKVTTDPEEYKKDSDNTALLTLTNGKRSFKLLMPTNMGKKSFFLEYATTSPADTSEIKNSAQFLIDNEPQLTWKKWGDKINTSKESVVTLKTVKAAGASVTADIAGKIKITKFDEADATVKLAGVVFEILRKSDGVKVQEVTTDANGVALSKALNDGKYIVKEKKTKSGYIVNSKEFEVEMKKEGVPLSISNKRKTVDFEATKTWVGGKSTDYKKVKLGLYVHKEGQTIEDSKPVSGSYTPEVTESNGVYTYKWKNQLPKYDVDGTKLIYSVRELQDTTELPLKEGEKVASGDHNYVVSYNADKTQVTNTYEVPKTKVTANKVWTGGKDSVRPSLFFKLYRTLEGGTAEAVTDADQKEVPKTDGTVEWSDLPVTDEHGVKYTYSVMEVDDEGNLVTTVDGYTANQTAGLTVTNKYVVKPTSASLEVTKKLTGRELKADEFEFVLKNDADGSELQKVKNTADGKVTFAPIEYTKAGTYNYTIVETNAGKTVDGVTYDNLEVKVKVEVTDDGEGKLHANVTYPADKEFNNSYGTSKAKASLEVTKKLTGRELKTDEFEFTLTDQVGNVEKAKNGADGKVKFSELTFDEAGTYTYTIKEVKAGTTENGITYDAKTVTAKVTVTDDGQGKLHAAVEYSSDGTTNSTTFNNVYTPAGATTVTLGAKKVLEGKALEAGKYSFVLKKEDGSVVETVTNAADGSVTFAPISYDESQVGTHKYTISEVEGDETGITYDKTVQEVEVKVEKVSSTELKATASKEAKDLVFTNKYTPAKTSVSVKKAWDDKDNQDGKRPASVTVKLLADGQDTGKTLELNAANGWVGIFTDLDVNKAGKAIVYSVVEVTVTGYNSEVTGDPVSGFTITNNYTPETVNVKATKNWDDANNQDGKRPTKITINLLADGQKVDSKEIQAAPDGTWSVEFTKLAKYKDGKEIKYTVTEEAVAEYESTITDFTITNKYAPKAIDYKVTKVWKDANNQDGKRPESVTVQLYKKVGDADPVAVEGKKLTLTAKEKTDDNTWVASFTNLPQYEAGKEVTYSIKEVDVPAGYEASVTGQVVTNTHNPDTVILSGTKVWKDNNNQSGKRADKVKVQILNGDKVVQEIEVSEATGWKFESKALPKYENGTEIKYTVKEVAVAEYKSVVTDHEDGKYTITNTHTPAKINVKGQKIWDDANNKDGIRPDSIVVKLLANGVETGKTATASVASGWTYEFTDLDRYQDGGKEIVYTVKEAYVPKGYTSEVIGTNIVNHHKPKDPEPNKPQDPEPNKPKDPEPGKPEQKPQLPNTGEKASNAAVVAGLTLMAVTGGLYFVSRKNK